MPDDFDAFGRKKDDAGLGDLGWGTGGPAPQPPQPVAPAPAPARPAARRNPAGVLVPLVALLVIAGVVALAVSAGRQANDSAKKTLDGFSAVTKPKSGSKTDDGDSSVPKQVEVASYFTPKGLRAGLRILAKEQPGKISNFSMRKDRIDVQVVRGGKTHIVELQAGAEVPQEYSSSAAVAGTDTLSYEELNAGAPARLLRAANARLNTSSSKADYFVAETFTGAMEWIVYYKNGHAAQGDSRGRFSRKLA